MKSILLLSLALSHSAFCGILDIGDTSKADAKIIAGYGSYHFSGELHQKLNEVNPAIGFEAWDIQSVYIHRNSWDSRSLYLTYSPDYIVNDNLKLSVNVGVATGYKCGTLIDGSFYLKTGCSKIGVVPLVGATASYYPTGGGLSLSITATVSVVMFSIGYDL